MKNKVIIYYISQILLFTATSLFNPVSYLFYMDNGLNLSVIGVVFLYYGLYPGYLKFLSAYLQINTEQR